jgi:hypothetical protein
MDRYSYQPVNLLFITCHGFNRRLGLIGSEMCLNLSEHFFGRVLLIGRELGRNRWDLKARRSSELRCTCSSVRINQMLMFDLYCHLMENNG